MGNADTLVCPLLGLLVIQLAAMCEPHVVLVPPNFPDQMQTTFMHARMLLCQCALLLPCSYSFVISTDCGSNDYTQHCGHGI